VSVPATYTAIFTSETTDTVISFDYYLMRFMRVTTVHLSELRDARIPCLVLDLYKYSFFSFIDPTKYAYKYFDNTDLQYT